MNFSAKSIGEKKWILVGRILSFFRNVKKLVSQVLELYYIPIPSDPALTSGSGAKAKAAAAAKQQKTQKIIRRGGEDNFIIGFSLICIVKGRA